MEADDTYPSPLASAGHLLLSEPRVPRPAHRQSDEGDGGVCGKAKNKILKHSATKPQPKTRPLHHGGTETRRKTKDKWVLFGPPGSGGFIQGRVAIFRTCLPRRKMMARKNKDKNLRFLRFLCVSRFCPGFWFSFPFIRYR